ncbi:MAG TPA: glycosyltransferase family 4 protein [Thermoanaerobaculia bacterium]|nr:glycosyltransferase family 4 protein [Thermoanaerobaculia bacterium]
MRILHLAAGNRWTGAAAPAFAEVEALRAAGHDAHYAYVGGYKLQAKIDHFSFAHPIIEKNQNPASFLRSVRAVERLVHAHGFDVLHTHLTYDHWLARFVARDHPPVRLARTFHARRVLRRDPLSRSLLAATALRFVINRDFVVPGAFFTPPPIDHRQFHPDGPRIDLAGPIVTVIGKLSPGRGFEEAIHTLAKLRERVPCRLMIIGHGEHRPALEALVRELGVDVFFAGYHEDDLAEHYRASSLLLFTARGSDEGHRAVLEAMACGVPVATMPIEGMDALVPREWIAAANDPEALAVTAAALLANPPRDAYERSLEFGYEPAARRLIAAYAPAMPTQSL